ncbi:hypothetical protein RSOLAG22IIIB_04556 [Rhizoctonia solani]|uniref:Uncharacterized protein n=1 Tax=Rhizoctonia solani TaxID=456999 RepID=A0A0K6FZ25_9AGAM|nr:unnamed protein product [Rhizoctonia solani]CUA71343.1 hypothetical protein RSOLAG22IIIB_04556 [Rhizoctonia solani]
MAAYAGFYATPEAWSDWMRSSPSCPDWQWGDTTTELILNRVLGEKKLGKHFYAELVPVPPSEPGCQDELFGMMLVRRKRPRRAYIAQKPNSKYDLTGQQMLKELIGLEVSGWKTMWYNGKSQWPPYEAQFLEPGDSTKKRKANRKTGNRTKNKVKSKTETRGIVGSQEGEEEHDGKHKDGAEQKSEYQPVEAGVSR